MEVRISLAQKHSPHALHAVQSRSLATESGTETFRLGTLLQSAGCCELEEEEPVCQRKSGLVF